MSNSVTSPFSEHTELVRILKLKNRHFARLYEELIEINVKITALENEVESIQNKTTLHDLKIRRLFLTEQLHEMLLTQND